MLQVGYAATDSYGLSFLDLHIDRNAELVRTRAHNVRNFCAIFVLLVLCTSIAVPVSLQALKWHLQLLVVCRQTRNLTISESALDVQSGAFDQQIEQFRRYCSSRNSRISWQIAILGLADELPEEVSIDQLQISTQGSVVNFAASGSAEDMLELSLFLGKLSASPIYSDIHLQESSSDSTTGQRCLSYTISGSMQSLIPPSPTAGS